jgi:hypothetical protein
VNCIQFQTEPLGEVVSSQRRDRPRTVGAGPSRKCAASRPISTLGPCPTKITENACCGRAPAPSRRISAHCAPSIAPRRHYLGFAFQQHTKHRTSNTIHDYSISQDTGNKAQLTQHKKHCASYKRHSTNDTEHVTTIIIPATSDTIPDTKHRTRYTLHTTKHRTRYTLHTTQHRTLDKEHQIQHRTRYKEHLTQYL